MGFYEETGGVDKDAEFDMLVDQFNAYIEQLKSPKYLTKMAVKNFIAGMGSVLQIFRGDYPTHEEVMKENGHPLYVHDGLDDSKRNLIILASDFKKVMTDLESKVKEGSEAVESDGLDHERDAFNRLYDDLKTAYKEL